MAKKGTWMTANLHLADALNNFPGSSNKIEYDWEMLLEMCPEEFLVKEVRKRKLKKLLEK